MLSKIKLLALFLALACAAHAQFFESMKKPVMRSSAVSAYSLTGIGDTVTDEPVLEKNEFRPTVNILSTGVQIGDRNGANAPTIVALTGAGVSYGHYKYNKQTEKWNSTWTVNFLTWYNRTMSGPEAQPLLYGATLGLFDSKIMAGFALGNKKKSDPTPLDPDPKGGTVYMLTLGVGIPLNNL